MTKKTMRRMCVAAGLLVGSVTAQAFTYDAQIMIDRALNSPTLTVKYKGAHAALVELRVNGESLGTRSVTASKDAGETNFTLNLTDLKDGENDVEVRLFDRTGKLVGSDHSNISTEQTLNAPVYLTTPKVGQTVRGSVDIKLGFGDSLKDVYVSFFVDNNFKAMTNFPPFQYAWDSTGETNGWHELEAWAIDGNSTTFKSRKVKVFVNNPGGRTYRVGSTDDQGAPSVNPSRVGLQDTTERSDIRFSQNEGQAATLGGSTGVAPTLHGGSTSRNMVHAEIVDTTTGEKPLAPTRGISTSVRQLLPTGSRVAATVSTPILSGPIHVRSFTTIKSSSVAASKAHPKNNADLGEIVIVPHHDLPLGAYAQKVSTIPTASVLGNVEAVSSLIQITRGQRIPNLGSFAVVLNSQFVNFDVPTRVDDGVPMAPFRHLIEKSGGSVDWQNSTKTVNAQADGHSILLQIGDKNARINNSIVPLDLAPYIDRGRTIVPISFMRSALNVNVEYDKTTGHVLITSNKK